MKIVPVIAMVLFGLLRPPVSHAAEIQKAPPAPAPDERYKADILYTAPTAIIAEVSKNAN